MSEIRTKKIIYAITKASWGGAQKYVADLAQYFHTQENCEVLVVHGKNEFGGESIFVNTLNNAGIKTIELKSLGRDISVLTDVWMFVEFLKLFWKERPDIVHLNSPKVGGTGGYAAWVLRVRRIVYTVHGLSHFEDRPQWQKMLIIVFTWLTFLPLHTIILISQREYDAVARWPLVTHKRKLVYNGVDDIDFFDRESARKKIEAQTSTSLDGKTILVNIGELTKNKGLTYMLDALTELKKERDDFIYVHWGTGELEEELKEKTEQLGLGAHVFWLGFDRAAKRYLKGCDIFVLPSVKEGLPYVLLEAALAALPVIASDVGGVSEIITDEKEGILVYAKDIQQITLRLQQLIENQAIREEYGIALQAKAATTFAHNNMTEQIHQLYSL